jgi:hypothetical protein
MAPKGRRRDPLPQAIVNVISALAVTVDGYKRGRPTMEGKAEVQEKIEETVRELVSRG